MDNSGKQREDMRKAYGGPVLALEFDVYAGNKVSMWCHVNHALAFDVADEAFKAAMDHLASFIKDGPILCPYSPNMCEYNEHVGGIK